MQKRTEMEKIDLTNLQFETPAAALAKWNPHVVAKKSREKSLNIYSTIGEYGDGEGMTPAKVAKFLKEADGEDVSVNINSPGGDFFDGLAINTLLANYSGGVEIKVVGLAASAASLVALAGKNVQIADGGFFMIHNSWAMSIGNRHDMDSAAQMLAKFDKSMVDLYAEKTGLTKKKIRDMMDDETWIDAKSAVASGFADAIMGAEEIDIDEEINNEYNASLKCVDVALAKSGMPRSKRRELLKELTGTPRAAKTTTPSAGNENELCDALKGLHATLTQKGS